MSLLCTQSDACFYIGEKVKWAAIFCPICVIFTDHVFREKAFRRLLAYVDRVSSKRFWSYKACWNYMHVEVSLLAQDYIFRSITRGSTLDC